MHIFTTQNQTQTNNQNICKNGKCGKNEGEIRATKFRFKTPTLLYMTKIQYACKYENKNIGTTTFHRNETIL